MRSPWLKRSIGYGLFALVLLVAIVYIRLPANFLERYVASLITENQPDLLVTLADAKPQFPAGVRLEQLVVRFLSRENATVEFEKVSAAAALASLLTGRLALSVDARAYGGGISGTVAFADRFSGSGPIRADVKFEEVNLGNCSYARVLSGRQVEGRASGTLLYSGRLQDSLNGTGRLAITLRDGSIRFLSPVFGLDRLDFSRADGEAVLENRSLKIRNLQLAGKDFQGTFSGQILLDNDIQQSRLDMRGTLTFTGQHQSRQSISLTGPLADPAIQFL
ncbi:MAG TPA: type II secretion system protein GspN [Syntrophales bacterium]|nr:type II secretion system protein GspN [Syntrophales bacterium]HOX94544.1 type II secretion system protein GspN [Syntrophales bacterium]HPI58296.1 type II secretion system protein GspN [Syntrophales bacterium]HPN26114.1 type II secretion system protein GspN [Syntrophales bacterium]HQM30491.1 type II secretion system protein GspN [Syntrophales bacterium]